MAAPEEKKKARLRVTTLKHAMYLGTGLVVLVMLALLVFSLYSVRTGSSALSSVYERQVVPSSALLDLDRELKEIRFRMAGYLIDQTPAVGNRNHLREARERLRESWTLFQKHHSMASYTAPMVHDHALVTEIEQQLPAVEALLDRLDAAYAKDSKRLVWPILEDEWPFVVHLHVLKPLAKLLPALQDEVKATYETNLLFGRQILFGAVMVLFISAILLIHHIMSLIGRINEQIGGTVRAADRIARGDLAYHFTPTSYGEIEQLVDSIDRMRTEIRSRERAMEATQNRLQAVQDHAAEAIITITERGLIESFNKSAEKLFGYRADEVLGQNVSILIPSPHREAHDGYLASYRKTGEKRIIGSERELEAVHKNGHIIPIALKVSEVYVEGKRMFTGLIADISERKAMLKKLQAREQRLATILDNAAEGVITFDKRGLIDGFNQAAEKLFGWSEQEVIGTPIALLFTLDKRERREGYLQHFMRHEIQRLIGHEAEVIGRHKDGTAFPMAMKISTMKLGGKQLYTALMADISERKAMVDHLKFMAEHDGLTGLYNRSYLQEELERVVGRAQRENQYYALLYIDLDNFKYVNDTQGHAAGDELLIKIATLLKRRARKSDLVARMGGDEFTVLLYNIKPELAGEIAESYRKSLSDYHFRQGSQELDVGCSIGVSLIQQDTKSAEEVMSQADVACHLAKRGGRNRVHVYRTVDSENVTTMSLDMGWSRRIKEAIEYNRFALACQPIVRTQTRGIDAYEVLIRLLDEEDKLIMPGGFLPAAERFGLSADIDKWVITNAIDTLVWQRASMPELRYSINLSAQTLADPAICDLIRCKLAETGLDPAALTFEVTETVAISDMVVATEILSQLQGLGCKTALDDFGAGMSSFAYLKDLPVDIVKIDGRFVKHLDSNPVDQAMVRAMNDIVHALGKQTVAEFVENEETFRLLVEYGIDYGQGYHLGRPDVTTPCKAISEYAGKAVVCQIPARS